MSALAQLHRCHSPLTEKTLRCQVGNAQDGELFGALLAGFKVEDGTLVFECFGQSGFGDERGESYPEAEDGDVSGDTVEQTVEQKQATLSKKRENVTTREAAVAEATAKLKRVMSMACGELEPEPEPSEGVPPS